MLQSSLLAVLKLRHPFKSHFFTEAAVGAETLSFHNSICPLLILVKQCKSLVQVKQIHQQFIVRGLASTALMTMTHVIHMYLTYDASSNALTILESFNVDNSFDSASSIVFSWNTLIRRSVRLGLLDHVFYLYCRMQRLGWHPDGYTLPYVLKASGELTSFKLGTSVHAVVYSHGLDHNVFVCNAIISMYGRFGVLYDAQRMFDEMSHRNVIDVISWNSIVATYVQNGNPITALKLFSQMTYQCDFEFSPNAVSLVNILPACASIGSWWQGKQVYSYAVRRGLFEDVFVGNAIVDMYAKCGLMNDANKVFERMEVKDVVSWNAMVTGYSQIGRFEEALNLFEKMREENIELNVVTWSAVISGYAQRDHGYEAIRVFRHMQLCEAQPNVVTVVSLLSGCASIGALFQGKETHCYAIKCMLNIDGNDRGEDLMLINGLIDMYAKCKNIRLARTMFDSISLTDRNVVTWTVMIGGYAQHGEANDALALLFKMLNQKNSIMPNAFTISCALMACASLGSLRLGKEIHAYVLRSCYELTMVFVPNCLIEMYAKSGNVDAARVVFGNMHHRNTVSWTSLMTGFGMHGRGVEALQIFDGMQNAGMEIDAVTFVVVLYACSHSGMVDQGIKYFNSMSTEFSIVPGIEHYACMVDLLGRAGRLDEAMKLIKDMPVEPSPVVWVALLSGCRIHGNVELGEYAAEKLLELESENDGSYTLLSNIYANARRWKDVARIRSLMKHTGIKKRPGCSWIQGKKGTATFFVGDKSHAMSEQIYDTLGELIYLIKNMGYVPETRCALHDVDDEEKGDLLFEHSEKLALAYGILTTAPGLPIRITKNLRICGDCHSAITYISKIIDNEIILRDSSRFHHFKYGSCSCKGYW